MKQLMMLIVEDDKPNREMVAAAFQEDGHTVCCTASLEECRKALKTNFPDIIILDRGLPDGDGLQLCLTLKKDPRFKSIPILMLTGKADVTDRILGLRFGADDYLTKPYELEELRARVGAIARRVYGDHTGSLTRCGITMNFKARTVTRRNHTVELTNREFDLLRVFMENPNTVLTRDALVAAVWSDTRLTNSKVVDVTVMNLRRKIGGAESAVSAVRSFGYKFISAE
jgi:DNA-binding response OmpR family regulator